MIFYVYDTFSYYLCGIFLSRIRSLLFRERSPTYDPSLLFIDMPMPLYLHTLVRNMLIATFADLAVVRHS